MRKALSFFIGTLLGGIIGAVAALLFAPSSGENLRQVINERLQELTTDVREAANSKRIELQERLDSLRTPRS